MKMLVAACAYLTGIRRLHGVFVNKHLKRIFIKRGFLDYNRNIDIEFMSVLCYNRYNRCTAGNIKPL